MNLYIKTRNILIPFNAIKKLILLAFLCFTTQVFAQGERGIDFIRGTFENAQKLAKQQGKLVFISYENYGGNSRWMNQNVFPTSEVGIFFAENFVSLKINSESLRDKSANSDFKYYGASSAYFFFTADGELIYKSHFASNPKDLLSDANRAIRVSENFLSLDKLDKMFRKGEQSPEMFYLYSLRRLQAVNVGSNKEREKNIKELDKAIRGYILGLDKKSLASEQNMLLLCEYLYETNKTADDELFKIMVANSESLKGFNEENAIGLRQRVSRIIDRSFNQAVLNKNEELMNNAVAAISPFWYERSTPLYNKEMVMASYKIDFYEVTKNWDSYSREITSYLNRIDAIDTEALTNQSVAEYKKYEDKLKFTPEEWTMLRDDIFNGYNEEVAYQLRLYGWRFAQNITDKEQLKLPLKWLSKSLRISENPIAMKTYSQLLYKVGREQEAKKYAEDAVKVAKGQVIARDFREEDSKNK
ncbi:hypothetical protein GCM10011514_27080 [Emticicia aquatilis]|uniref:DUF255 domain-containing protein n=1 Tax=Emticicia aquatilis TaxID=1537369 RepID=A0A916YUJ8_9BACT|nr:hypothetical protein [Emticicia aquatilis]GGD61617.1 hypothetical protein GCM10011514_27080 [Emticicia aquatilis]